MPAKPPACSLACSPRACSHAASPRPPAPAPGPWPAASETGVRLPAIPPRARSRNLSTLSRPPPALVTIAPPSDAEQVSDPAPMLPRRPPGDPVHSRPPQIHVNVVLPRHTKTTVQLHAVLDDVGGTLPRVRLSDAHQLRRVLPPLLNRRRRRGHRRLQRMRPQR